MDDHDPLNNIIRLAWISFSFITRCVPISCQNLKD